MQHSMELLLCATPAAACIFVATKLWTHSPIEGCLDEDCPENRSYGGKQFQRCLMAPHSLTFGSLFIMISA